MQLNLLEFRFLNELDQLARKAGLAAQDLGHIRVEQPKELLSQELSEVEEGLTQQTLSANKESQEQRQKELEDEIKTAPEYRLVLADDEEPSAAVHKLMEWLKDALGDTFYAQPENEEIDRASIEFDDLALLTEELAKQTKLRKGAIQRQS